MAVVSGTDHTSVFAAPRFTSPEMVDVDLKALRPLRLLMIGPTFAVRLEITVSHRPQFSRPSTGRRWPR